MQALATRWRFRRLGPWTTNFILNGSKMGGFYDPRGDERVAQAAAAFPRARRILELGSLEGGLTLELRKAFPGAQVTCVEGRAENLRRARFVLDHEGVTDVALHEANLETTPLSSFGTFDLIFCVGLLYHLPRPWELLRQMPAVAPALYLHTHHAGAKPLVDHEGHRGHWYNEFGYTDPLSGLSPRSFWLDRDELVRAVRDAGYDVLHVREMAHPNGPAVSLTAQVPRP